MHYWRRRFRNVKKDFDHHADAGVSDVSEETSCEISDEVVSDMLLSDEAGLLLSSITYPVTISAKEATTAMMSRTNSKFRMKRLVRAFLE